MQSPGENPVSRFPGKRWLSWQRLACLAATVIALVIIFRRIDLTGLRTALWRMEWGWFALALGSYGLALLLVAVRWHGVLRLTGTAVHLSATTRVAFIGHYFVLILFGGVAGDAAKSSVYARWYKRGFPEVFATAPLDRLLGLGGLILFCIDAFGFAFWQGGLQQVPGLEVRWPSRWAIVGVALLLLAGAALLAWEPRGNSSPERLLRSIQTGGGRLLRRPALAAAGLFLGFMAQLCLSAALAFSLRAVTRADLPWMEILWTFPIISVASSLPVTVAGLGVREGAAIVLLGFFGVSTADALAASVLSLATNLLWGGVGALLLWREDRRQRQQPEIPPPQTVSVVIPTLNQADLLAQTVGYLRQLPQLSEIIVADGGSRDRTAALALENGCLLIPLSNSQDSLLRASAELARGDVLLLLPVGTCLPPHAGQALLDCLRDPLVVAGGFWPSPRPPWRLPAAGKCAVRFFIQRRIPRDQAFFVRRAVLDQIGGVAGTTLLSEAEFYRRLRKLGRLALADAAVRTRAES